MPSRLYVSSKAGSSFLVNRQILVIVLWYIGEIAYVY